MATAILGLWAETSIHPGAGSSQGVIDLPVQREAHTGWPVVFGSGAKGALRNAADDWIEGQLAAKNGLGDGATPQDRDAGEMEEAIEQAARNHGASWVDEVFGPPTSRASDHAGALAVGDARLLLLPVRSLTTHFKWVTCPALLRRAIRDSRRLGFAVAPALSTRVSELTQVLQTDESPPPAGNEEEVEESQAPKFSSQVILPLSGKGPTPPPPNEGKLFLEQLSFRRNRQDLSLVIAFLAPFLGDKDNASQLLKDQLAVVDDDTFAHLARFATPITPHIAIENANKRVKDGALWYEETLPPDTVMYVALLAQHSRRLGSHKTADEILLHIKDDLFSKCPYLRLGGNETVGMGWFHVAPRLPMVQEVK